jgi:hypothetical protein
MVQFIRHAGVPNIHMGEFCRWWSTRCEVLTGTALALAGSDLEVRFRAGGKGLWVRMTRPGGKEALVPAEPHIDLEKVSWRQELHAVPQPGDISRIRGFNPWVVLIRLEDSLKRKG